MEYLCKWCTWLINIAVVSPRGWSVWLINVAVVSPRIKKRELESRLAEMALVSGGRSTLNPDAPLFIPAAYRQVEDFSPEWWQLVTTSTWYRDYWLSQHQDAEGFYDNADDNITYLLCITYICLLALLLSH